MKQLAACIATVIFYSFSTKERARWERESSSIYKSPMSNKNVKFTICLLMQVVSLAHCWIVCKKRLT